MGQRGRECAAAPWGIQRAMLEGVLSDEAVEVCCELTRHLARSTGPWAVQQALGPLLGQALHPCAHSSMGQVEGQGDGGDVWTRDHRTDGLGTAKDPRCLGLLEHGV